jgi:hypothetical protein
MKPIATLDDAKSWIDSGFPEPTTVMALDLTALDGRFANARLEGSAFLGCRVGETLRREIHRSGAGMIADLPGLPARLPAFATKPYTVGEAGARNGNVNKQNMHRIEL